MAPSLFWIVASAFCVASIATGVMRRYALRANLLDVPNARSSHLLPTPRGGGLAIVLAFSVALIEIAFVTRDDVAILTALLAGGGAIAFIGFLDDHRTLPAVLRLAVHVLAGLIVVVLLGGIPESALARWGLHSVFMGMGVAVVALVWVTNLFNFMDGIDGVAGIEVAFVSIVGAWMNWQAGGESVLTAATLCLAASSAGFLIWNWPPARIFMGDVGSGFLGFTIAVLGLVISRQGAIPIEVWVILSGVFVVDATVTLVRRIFRGDRWFEAHRMHAYQHLANRWNSHLRVTLVITVINLIWLLPWALLAARNPSNALWCLLAAFTPLVALALAFGAGSHDREVWFFK
jgi:Fuc2NAc and GlcNAc transferase